MKKMGIMFFGVFLFFSPIEPMMNLFFSVGGNDTIDCFQREVEKMAEESEVEEAVDEIFKRLQKLIEDGLKNRSEPDFPEKTYFIEHLNRFLLKGELAREALLEKSLNYIIGLLHRTDEDEDSLDGLPLDFLRFMEDEHVDQDALTLKLRLKEVTFFLKFLHDLANRNRNRKQKPVDFLNELISKMPHPLQ